MIRTAFILILIFQLQISYAAEIPAPLLAEPPDSSGISGSPIRFVWESVKNAKSYNIIIFENDKEYYNTNLSSTSFQLRNPFLCNTYSWMVRAIDSNNNYGYWSEKRYLIPYEAQTAALVYPENNSVDYDYRTGLIWNIEDTLAVSKFVVKIDQVITLNSNELIILNPYYSKTAACVLEPFTKYYWQVMSINCGDTSYSNINSFTTKFVNTPLPSTLIYPENNSEINNNKQIEFKWKVPLGADTCIVMLADDKMNIYTLCTLKVNPLDYLMTWIHEHELRPNSEFSWYVITRSNGKPLNSEIWNFRTINGSSGIRSYQPDLTISPNPASDFIEISCPPSEKRGLGGVSVHIFDILGIEQSTPSVLRTDTPQEGNLRIDVSSLSPGVYFVRLGNEIRKFVKM